MPKLRLGSYFPGWMLEPRRRAERALWADYNLSGEQWGIGIFFRDCYAVVHLLGLWAGR